MRLQFFPQGFKIENLAKLDRDIRAMVPFGNKVREISFMKFDIFFDWKSLNIKISRMFMAMNKMLNTYHLPDTRVYNYEWFGKMCKRVGIDQDYAEKSIGTLGGGNHFIELGIVKSTGDLALTVHSGSRNLGKKICEYWQDQATKGDPTVAKEVFNAGVEKIKNETTNRAEIPTKIAALKETLKIGQKGPGYLEGEEMIGYLADMIFAEHYAELNRRIIIYVIMQLICQRSYYNLHDAISTVHNYIDFEDFVIRKGAVSARQGQVIVIPFNMEDGLIICKGKGNTSWNCSAPHGAGRLFSRREAKELINGEESKERMIRNGIYTSAVPADESKEAYKDSAMIEAAIGPTVEIVDRVKPILNLKEGDES